MNCPSCAKPLPANAPKCPACGKTVSLLPETYDLMPEEPAKTPEADPFAPPPGLLQGGPTTAASPEPGPKPMKPPFRPQEWAPTGGSPFEVNKGMAFAGGLLLLMIAGIAWKTCGPEPSEIKGRFKTATPLPFQLAGERPQVVPFEVKGAATYTFEVSADDGEVLMGVIKRVPGLTATVAALKGAPEGLVPVIKDNTRTLEGKLSSGQYWWVVVNDSKKLVKGRMKYVATPD